MKPIFLYMEHIEDNKFCGLYEDSEQYYMFLGYLSYDTFAIHFNIYSKAKTNSDLYKNLYEKDGYVVADLCDYMEKRIISSFLKEKLKAG